MGQTFRMQPDGPDTGPTAPEVVATWFRVEVPMGPHLTPEVMRTLQDGTFAAGEARAALASILPADRVLLLQAGPGILAAAIARNCRPASIMAFESDPALVAEARGLCRHNGLDAHLTIRHGLVRAQRGAKVPDRSAACAEGAVPIAWHDDLRRTYLPNVIVTDLATAEGATLRRANLTGVRMVLLARPSAGPGPDVNRQCRRALGRAGFELDLGLSGPGADLFRRIRA